MSLLSVPTSSAGCLTSHELHSAASHRTNGKSVLQRGECVTIGKIRTVAGVEIRFRRQAIGDERIMRVQLDVPACDRGAGHLGYRGAV